MPAQPKGSIFNAGDGLRAGEGVMAPKRSYGTGSLYESRDRNGRVVYYGRWRSNGRRVNRAIGPKRTPGSTDGLTRSQAERELRRLMQDTAVTPAARGDLTVADLLEKYERHQATQGLKRSTLTAIESASRVWLVPRLGDRPAARVSPEDVEDLMASMRTAGVGPKSIRNYIGTLSSAFKFGMHARRRWVTVNPCEAVDLPAKPKRGRRDESRIEFLTPDEVRALSTAAVEGPYQEVDRALYLFAGMTGLRQGEQLGLRWCDVDWQAQRVRVEQTHVLGEFDTPKSEKGWRSVPLATEVGAALDALSRASQRTGDMDLVFGDPFTGEPLKRGALMRRYRRALKAALLPEDFRYHNLRHSFATAMAAAGVSMHTLQEWLGHEDAATTAIYKHYAPNAHEVDQVNAAFAPTVHSTVQTERTSADLTAPH